MLTELYGRLGYRAVFQDYSGRRALVQANNGVTGAEAMRIAGMEKEFPNLIPVPVPIVRITGRAYTKSVTRPVRAVADLKGLRVGIVRGVKIAEKSTRDLEDVYVARSMTVLFNQLTHDRLDVALAAVMTARYELAVNFKDSGIHAIGEPLYSVDLYHYLHKSRADLVAPLTQLIRELTENGELDRIYDRKFMETLEGGAGS